MSAYTWRARLVELFPPHDERSSWMFRLAILRDDISHELQQLGLAKEDDFEKVWRSAYAIRRLALISEEARNIFEGDIEPWASKTHLREDLRKWVKKWAQELKAARPVMEPLRNAFGGHVRPSSAAPRGQKVGHAERMIGALGGAVVEGTVDLGDARNTKLHRITGEFFLLLWPEILGPNDDGSESDAETRATRYQAKHTELSEAVFSSAKTVIQCCDALLAWFWLDLELQPVV